MSSESPDLKKNTFEDNKQIENFYEKEINNGYEKEMIEGNSIVQDASNMRF